MSSFAPRYDPRLVAAIDELDDRSVPMAEVWRRLGAFAVAHGIPRPSYQHVARYLAAKRAAEDAERARREALRAVASDVAARVINGRYVDPYHVADRIAEINERFG